MYLGSSFAGAGGAFNRSGVKSGSITAFTLKNMVLGELFATKKVLMSFNWNIPKDWDFDTHLHALFKNDLYAGNVAYSESVVQKVKIKKRFKGEFTWKTIYEKDIHSNEDFNIEFFDYYEPSNKDIEYAYVAVIANSDADPISTAVRSEFDCYFICDKNENFPIELTASTSITLNRESKTIVSPGNKYPYVVNNGITKYYSGTLTASFIELPDGGDYDVDHGWAYRNRVDGFLSDGRPKILKTFEGDMYMIQIVGSLPRTADGHYQNVSHQIEWVECGDPARIADLYDNGFIDVDIDREQVI